jgi:ABC-type glycerol-3-phosphate transport system substrate-binding protein
LVKRAIALFITAGLLLAACQPAVSTPTPGSSVTPASATATVPTSTAVSTTQEPEVTQIPTSLPHLQLDPGVLNGINVRFFHPWTGATSAVLAELTREFNQENQWGIQVETTAAGGADALRAQIEANLESNGLPHLVAAEMPDLLAWEAEAGLINLNDYINDAQWGLTDQDRADFPKVFWDEGLVENRRYGIPALRSPQVLFYNLTLAQELGFSRPPATLDDFEQQSCAAAHAKLADDDPENDGTGGWVASYEALGMLSWMKSFGLSEPYDNEAGAFRFNRQAGRSAFTFLHDLYTDDCAWTGRQALPYEYFATRRALFYSGSLADIPTQVQVNQHLGATDEWTVIAYPAPGDNRPVVIASGPSYAVFPASAEEQLSAWLFLRYLVQPENQVRMAEASAAWPASVRAIDRMSDYRNANPQWAQSLQWIPIVQTAPAQIEWRLGRVVLGDAGWQLFQPNTTAEQIPAIVRMLDETLQEIQQSINTE